MKKTLPFLIILFLAVIPFLRSQQEKEPVKETVEVVNVEVPVRVYYKGKPVDNLTKSDFKIYEGKKLQTINGFFIKRKKIKVQTIEVTAEQKKVYSPRHFVLVFRITDYNQELQDGVNHLFNNILKETDQLLTFANNKSRFFNNLENKQSIQEKIEKLLIEQSQIERNRMLVYLKKIEQELNIYNFKMTLRNVTGGRGSIDMGSQKDYIKNFLRKYLIIWQDYKKRYLVPNIDNYYFFSRHLEKIKMEKWVVNFYQMEMFPRIILTGELMRQIRGFIHMLQTTSGSLSGENAAYARMITRLLSEIDKELNVSSDFPAEEVSKLFYKVNATFHSIFLRTNIATLAQDLEYKRISTDIENSLREITKRTGGTLVATNKLETALDTISEKEDIYYLLTYAPKDPKKIEKIKVKVKNRKYKLTYYDTIRAGFMTQYVEKKEIEGPPAKIEKLTFKNKKLSMVITNFYIGNTKKGRQGKLEIRIRIKNRQDINIFDQTKELTARQKKISLSLNITGISRGKYDIVVDVKDLNTNKTATELIQTEIKD